MSAGKHRGAITRGKPRWMRRKECTHRTCRPLLSVAEDFMKLGAFSLPLFAPNPFSTKKSPKFATLDWFFCFVFVERLLANSSHDAERCARKIFSVNVQYYRGAVD